LKKDNKNNIRKFYYIILIVITVFSFAYSIRGSNGFIKILKLKKEIAMIKNEIERIERENELLRARIESLKKDRRSIEFVAREELGMIREDEYLILFKDK
jgi:cell division protein FtsB